jgi:hypothetical protein
MSELVANCPRCGSVKMTFNLKAEHYIGIKYNWQLWYEAFCICRHCNKSTVFVLSLNRIEIKDEIARNGLIRLSESVNNCMSIEGFINLKHAVTSEPPEFLPEPIAEAFREGATCIAVECFNAAATMFRLCLDLATRPLLPETDTDENGLNSKIRRDLGLRLPWLFKNKLLPSDLQELSVCVKEDGNDGAHAGTLKKEDAEDLLEFTHAFLDRLYSESERLRLAKERRISRRAPKSQSKPKPTLLFLFTNTSAAALSRWNRDHQPHRERLAP